MNPGKGLLEKFKDEVLENTRWRTAQEKPTEEEVRLRSGERSEESRNINLENEVKIGWQESSQGSESTSCKKVKQRRKISSRE